METPRDQNHVPVKMGTLCTDGVTLVPIALDASGNVKVDQVSAINRTVLNSDCSFMPTYVADTTAQSVWIDGTASGSLTNDIYKWAVTVTGTATSSARFETNGSVTSVRLAASNMDKSGGITDQLLISQIRVYSSPTIATSWLPYAIPVVGGGSYTATADVYIESLSDAAQVRASLQATYYTSAGARVSTSTVAASNLIIGDWQTISFTATAPATAEYAVLSCHILPIGVDGSGRSMTAQFTNMDFYSSTRPTVAPGNALRDENHIPVLMGVSSVDGVTPIPIYVNASGAILVDT